MDAVTTSISRGVVADMVVLPSWASRKTRKVYRMSSLATQVVYGVHANNMSNLRRAIVERVFYVEDPLRGAGLHPTPEPLPGIYERKMSGFANAIVSRVPYMGPLTYDEFIASVPAFKRAIYTRAVESLKALPLEESDSQITAFLKAEKIDFTAKEDPAPRIISPRTPRYNVEVGRYLRRLEKEMYKAIGDIFDGPTIMKGYNSEERGSIIKHKWDKFIDPVAIGLDASRFDQHVSVQALQWEHGIYLRCYTGTDRAHLAWLLKQQLKNKVKARCDDGSISYIKDGCRMSGDMNTSLGNCTIMCGLVHQYATERNTRIELVNDGDDCVVIMERRDASTFRQGLATWFRDMGFSMKVEDTVDHIEGIEFCQCRPVNRGDQYIMVRNPHRSLSKDATTLIDISTEQKYAGFMDAVGTGGLKLTDGMPVLVSYYRSMVRCGTRARKAGQYAGVTRDSGLARLGFGMTYTSRDIQPVTRNSFFMAFDITPDEQTALEHHYDREDPMFNTPVRFDVSLPPSIIYLNKQG